LVIFIFVVVLICVTLVIIIVIIIIATLLIAGIVLRLLMAVLTPVLPAKFSEGIAAGWGMLLDMVSPAMGPIMALGILVAVVWIVTGVRR